MATVFLCAPSDGNSGANIVSANGENEYYFNFGGTSAACALSSGIISFLLSLNPRLKREQVKEILKNTARKIPSSDYDSNGHSPKFGYGCINTLEAAREIIRTQ